MSSLPDESRRVIAVVLFVEPNVEAEPYEPTEEDWAEYTAWSRGLDAGVPVDALTLEEMELLTFTMTDRQWRDRLEDEIQS